MHSLVGVAVDVRRIGGPTGYQGAFDILSFMGLIMRSALFGRPDGTFASDDRRRRATAPGPGCIRAPIN